MTCDSIHSYEASATTTKERGERCCMRGFAKKKKKNKILIHTTSYKHTNDEHELEPERVITTNGVCSEGTASRRGGGLPTASYRKLDGSAASIEVHRSAVPWLLKCAPLTLLKPVFDPECCSAADLQPPWSCVGINNKKTDSDGECEWSSRRCWWDTYSERFKRGKVGRGVLVIMSRPVASTF